jgi:DNA-binding transcriptional LysR family regulator
MSALDVDAVRAFVLTADLSSFTRASEALGCAQAAISLKVKQLETRLNRRLLDRTPRRVRLTSDGIVFLEAARDLLAAHDRVHSAFHEPRATRFIIGISDHVAGPDLPRLLRNFSSYQPGLLIEVHVAPSRALHEEYDRGSYDAILIRCDQDRHGTPVFEDQVRWFAHPGFVHEPGTPVPLANLAAPCGIRADAIEALQRAGLPSREAFLGGGVLAVAAAASAGIAVAALAARLAPADTIDVGERLRLPPLPPSPIYLLNRRNDRQTRETLRYFIAACRPPGSFSEPPAISSDIDQRTDLPR